MVSILIQVLRGAMVASQYDVQANANRECTVSVASGQFDAWMLGRTRRDKTIQVECSLISNLGLGLAADGPCSAESHESDSIYRGHFPSQ